MYKSIISFILVSLLTISSVFANGVFAPIGEEQHFASVASMPSEWRGYFGVNLGGGYALLKPDVTLDRTSSGVTIRSGNYHDTKGSIHLNTGGYAGCGYNFDHFYLGGELSAIYNSLNKSINGVINESDRSVNHNLEVVVRQPFIAAFDIIPGYLTQARDFLFYGRLGVGAAWIKLKLSDSFSNHTVNTKANRWAFDWRAGLGMEYAINKTFGARLEYLFSFVGAKDDHSYTTSPGATGYTYKYTYGLGNEMIHTVNLGLSIYP